jgi:hypothetical protein
VEAHCRTSYHIHIHHYVHHYVHLPVGLITRILLQESETHLRTCPQAVRYFTNLAISGNDSQHFQQHPANIPFRAPLIAKNTYFLWPIRKHLFRRTSTGFQTSTKRTGHQAESNMCIGVYFLSKRSSCNLPLPLAKYRHQ